MKIALSVFLAFSLSSCATRDISVTDRTCSLSGSDVDGHQHFSSSEYRPYACIRAIDGSPVKKFDAMVVDAGGREIIAQTVQCTSTGTGASNSDGSFRTFRILADLQQGKSYQIVAKVTVAGTVLKVKDVTAGRNSDVDATISVIEGYISHGWPPRQTGYSKSVPNKATVPTRSRDEAEDPL